MFQRKAPSQKWFGKRIMDLGMFRRVPRAGRIFYSGAVISEKYRGSAANTDLLARQERLPW